jgi:hypothetical protein
MIEPATSSSDHHMLLPYSLGVACPGASGPCPPAPRYRTPGREIGRSGAVRGPRISSWVTAGRGTAFPMGQRFLGGVDGRLAGVR